MQDSFLNLLEKFKLPILLSILGIVLIIGGIFASGLNKKDTSARSGQDFPKESLVQGQKMISVDVSGAVKNPGVYQLKEGARIEDSIKVSGGFSENVNSRYVSKNLNMAQKLVDGSKVYVPFEGESQGGSLGNQGGVVAGVQSAININTASQSELESLPGIGPVTATKIISGRPYQTIEELLSKKAVSNSVFGKIKDQIVIY